MRYTFYVVDNLYIVIGAKAFFPPSYLFDFYNSLRKGKFKIIDKRFVSDAMKEQFFIETKSGNRYFFEKDYRNDSVYLLNWW